MTTYIYMEFFQFLSKVLLLKLFVKALGADLQYLHGHLFRKEQNSIQGYQRVILCVPYRTMKQSQQTHLSLTDLIPTPLGRPKFYEGHTFWDRAGYATYDLVKVIWHIIRTFALNRKMYEVKKMNIFFHISDFRLKN